ncbi:MAG: hypothetical protein BWX96_03179 [Bacteroidetes bacterium ADurb.Bin145]|jgi:hypothetical protein|uniref:hypothetical protein n=1 Tax=Methanospirillum sp. TaxID=45200 RepID=UPI0009CD2F1C|nr:hypothetical protein [Methanospirillum sp.]OQB57412.1 MAG: hypothetical protein BWX96_03179 [Bacteroidetes bacterium ADurb.Bin145]
MTPSIIHDTSVNGYYPQSWREYSSVFPKISMQRAKAFEGNGDVPIEITSFFGYSSITSIKVTGGTHSTSYIQSIIDRVKTDSKSTIIYFFQKNPEMISGVDEVIRRIDRIFPHNTQFFLEIRTDPDSGIDYIRLCVRLSHYPDDFFDIAFEIEESCSYLFSGSKSKFLLTTDFIPSQ